MFLRPNRAVRLILVCYTDDTKMLMLYLLWIT
jgi:hypothetical protein